MIIDNDTVSEHCINDLNDFDLENHFIHDFDFPNKIIKLPGLTGDRFYPNMTTLCTGRYSLTQIRLSSVTLVRPAQRVETFGSIFRHFVL